MSLNTSAPARAQHPVDLVENIAHDNAWPFDRGCEDEIAITVEGIWSDYQVSFTWLEDVEALHVACAFDIKDNHHYRAELMNLLANINQHLWVGHFGYWESEGLIIFRHALVLAGGVTPTAGQCQSILSAAVSACEQYYQAFQFVLEAGKNAGQALEGAMIETMGEA